MFCGYGSELKNKLELELEVVQYTPLNATSLNTKTGQAKTADQVCRYKNSLG